MNEEATQGGGLPPLAPAIPWPVWLLLVGAIVQLAVAVAPDSYQVFGPYFLVSGEMVLSWLTSMSPFLLAAVVVLAADRWREGRRLLLIGAAALAVVGLLDTASDIWWAIWQTAPGAIPDDIQPWLSGAHLGTGLVRVASHGFLAAGLWKAGAARSPGRTRIVLMVVIGMAGMAATGSGLWVMTQALRYTGTVDYLWVTVVGAALTAAGFGALAAVAVAAVRTAPRQGWIPEVLIAIGGTVTMVATAWTWSFPHLAPIQAWSGELSVWVFTVPNAAAALGMVAMIAGFGLGALAARRGPAAGGPIA